MIKKGKDNSKSFWQKLPKPFFVLAPMANVTDFAFRSMIAKYGKPDVMWNEFVSANGLCSAGKERLLYDLKFSEKERPIVAQLFTGNPRAMKEAAKLCAELGFDGVDLNMGCPDRAIEKQGSGAGHIKDPKRALEVLEAARIGWREGQKFRIKGSQGGARGGDVPRKGMYLNQESFSINQRKNKVFSASDEKISQLKDSSNQGAFPSVILRSFNTSDSYLSATPISVKTRIGYNKVEIDWLRLLLGQKLPALTVHLRTRKEMSDVPAHWDMMPEIVKLRDEVQKDIPVNERTLIIGNGDVVSVADGKEKCDKYGCDGVMIGRGIFGTPWLFSDIRIDTPTKTPEQRLTIMLEHTKLFEKTYCGTNKLKNFAVMKKHFKAYVSGWDGAKELRVKLMETNTYKEVKEIVDVYIDGMKK